MNCREADSLRNAGPLSKEMRSHLQDCGRCQRMQTVWDESSNTAVIAPEVDAAIRSSVTASLAPVASLASTPALTGTLLLLAAFAVSLNIWWFGHEGWEAQQWWQRLTIFSLLSASLASVAWGVAQQMSPIGKRFVPTSVLLAGPLAAFALVTVILFPFAGTPHFVRVGLHCWSLGLLTAVVTAPLLLWVLRRSAWLSPGRQGALAGLLAGLCGLTMLEVYCPYLDRGHVGVWHVGSAATAMALGFLMSAVKQP